MITKFTPKELKLITEASRLFNPKIVVYFATAEQIEQLKAVGVRGVSRKQKKD